MDVKNEKILLELEENKGGRNEESQSFCRAIHFFRSLSTNCTQKPHGLFHPLFRNESFMLEKCELSSAEPQA